MASSISFVYSLSCQFVATSTTSAACPAFRNRSRLRAGIARCDFAAKQRRALLPTLGLKDPDSSDDDKVIDVTSVSSSSKDNEDASDETDQKRETEWDWYKSRDDKSRQEIYNSMQRMLEEGSGDEGNEDEWDEEEWEKMDKNKDDPNSIIVKEDDDSYTIRGRDLERLLEQLQDDDFVIRDAESSEGDDKEDSDDHSGSDSESSSEGDGELVDRELDKGTKNAIRQFRTLHGETLDMQEEKQKKLEELYSDKDSYYADLAEAMKPNQKRKGAMNYFEDDNKQFMPSWVREAYESGDHDLISGLSIENGFDRDSIINSAPGRKRGASNNQDQMAILPGSTLQEVARDYRVPVEFIIDEVAALGAKKPVRPTDILQDRLFDDEIRKLAEVLTSFDCIDLQERYSDRTIEELAESYGVPMEALTDICEELNIYLCLGPQTHLSTVFEDAVVERLAGVLDSDDEAETFLGPAP